MSMTFPPEARAAVRGLPNEVAYAKLVEGVEQGLWAWKALSAFKQEVDTLAATDRPNKLLPYSAQFNAWRRGKTEEDINRAMWSGYVAQADMEAYAHNKHVMSARGNSVGPPPVRILGRVGVYRTRKHLTPDDRPNVQNQFVPKQSLAFVTDPLISDGAKVTMSVIMALCGKEATVESMTCSIATMRGVHKRTIQNHINELKDGGYLVASQPYRSPRDYRIKRRFVVDGRCRAPAFKPQKHEVMYKLARRSTNPHVKNWLHSIYTEVARQHPEALANRAARSDEPHRKEFSQINHINQTKVTPDNSPTCFSHAARLPPKEEWDGPPRLYRALKSIEKQLSKDGAPPDERSQGEP